MNLRIQNVTVEPMPVPGELEVPWSQWRSASAPDTLFTRGARQCIAISTYDASRSIGHMAHVYASERSQDKILPDFCRSVLDSCSNDTTELSVCIVGGLGNPQSPRLETAAISRRERFVEIVRNAGIIGNLETHWNDGYSHERYDLALDCSTGIHTLTIFSAPHSEQGIGLE